MESAERRRWVKIGDVGDSGENCVGKEEVVKNMGVLVGEKEQLRITK